MRLVVQAACGCDMGKLRKNNEDNFFFDGEYLEQENDGLKYPVVLEKSLKNGFSVAIFDGMGGEQFGEIASYVAARQMQSTGRNLAEFFVPGKTYMARLALELDKKVSSLKAELQTEHIGTTMVSLCFWGRYAYICNVGDSRAYRLRGGEFVQLSVDHVEKRPGRDNRKTPLTQYLGFGSEEIEIEPNITKSEIKAGDLYLLCSDGLTDMLTNIEITDILLECDSPQMCVSALLKTANEHGGRDNITVIACKLTREK